MTSFLNVRLSPSLPAPLPAVVTESLDRKSPLRGSVLALGNFDGFHLGHQGLVREAHRIAGRRPMSVMSCEPHPRSFFGRDDQPFRLATPTAKRWEIGQHGVDFIYSPAFNRDFAELGPEDFVDRILLESLGVTHVIAGPDFHFGRRRAGDMALLSRLGEARGFGVSIAPDIKHAGVRVSSTLVRSAIQAGDIHGAAQLMGHGWLVETRRVPGGLELHPTLCKPRPGRYVARHPGTEGYREQIVEIAADGRFDPLGPYQVDEPDMWRLMRQASPDKSD